MENISEEIKDKESKVIEENSKKNSKSISKTKNYIFDFNISNLNKKICEYSKIKYYTKLNKNSQINIVHF